jgi:RNA polymerase sigma factor (sigma-70 family)
MRPDDPTEIDVDEAAVKYAGLVAGVLRGFRLSEADRHDVAQTVWLRLLEKAHTLRDPAALPGWIRTTTRNEAISHLRRVSRCSPGPIGDQADSRLGPEDHVILAEERQAMARSFDALTDEDRELLSVTVLNESASYVQASQRLGRPTGSIGPSRQRALSRLKRNYAAAGSPYRRR